MECHVCSRPVPADALRCPHCQRSVTEPGAAPTMCLGCGRMLREGAAYCDYCGWSVDIGEDPPPPGPPPAVVAPAAAMVAPPAAEVAPPKDKPEILFQISVVPLTADQKRTLLEQIIWPPLILIVFAIVINVLAHRLAKDSGGGSPDGSTVSVFANLLIIIITLTGILPWLRHLRDLRRGVAHMQLTRLSGAISHQANTERRYYGYFEHVGKIAISSETYAAAITGATYQITYSPISKRLWEVELIHDPRPDLEQSWPVLPD